jgi:hypothetical protein
MSNGPVGRIGRGGGGLGFALGGFVELLKRGTILPKKTNKTRPDPIRGMGKDSKILDRRLSGIGDALALHHEQE